MRAVEAPPNIARLQETTAAVMTAEIASEHARIQRDAAIIAAWKSGMPQAEIARVTGVSRERIGQIVRAVDRP